MDHFLSEAKRLVQRLQHHDNAVDILIGETTNLQNKLIAMRQYKDEVVKMNQSANHRPKSTLILGSQLENQRIQSLEHENRELSISLAEHQSALELIMNKYREQVLVMIKENGSNIPLPSSYSQPSEKELQLSEQIEEMALVMRKSALIDENLAVKEIETMRSLQVENDNLRQLLNISNHTGSENKRENPQTPNTPNLAMQMNTPVLKSSSISNKDSGIYEEDYSPNFGAFTKNKKRKPLKSSKHIDNLEGLFRPSPPLLSLSAPTGEVIEHSDKNDEIDHAMDDVEEEQQHQMYTVEALVVKRDEDGDDASLTNGYLEEDMLVQDSKTILRGSENSQSAEISMENEGSDVQPEVSNLQTGLCSKAENNVIDFLDNILDVSENSDSEGEDAKDVSVTAGSNKNEYYNDFDDSAGNPINESVIDVGNDKTVLAVDISDEDAEHSDKNTKDTTISTYTVSEPVEQSENDMLDFLDNFDKEIEEDGDDDDSSDFHSDAESEVTVVGATDEDDAMALFDSMLDDEEEEEESDNDNDNE